MLFSSIPFLYYFLPCVLILYFIAPRQLKNTVLLVSSLVFYGWGEPVYLLLMIASISVGYLSALLIARSSSQKFRKAVMTVGVVISLSFLGYFKYADFLLENFSAVTGISVELLNIALPIGISFYTFQSLSYIVDVYRDNVSVQKNIINLSTYIAMFPQLIAGPIVRYSDIESRLTERKTTVEGFSLGVRRFVLGLSKKVLIANTLGELCDIFKTSDEKSVLFFWIYAASYCLHVYFDFSGYSDMAIGLGRILGFDFPENFNYPFISASITEFWRRWHMTLGSWFRDYVYIPMGGNRVGKFRHLINIFTVWMLTGLWHGASWNFVVWGLYFGILLIIEKFFLLKYMKKSKVLSHFVVLLLVAISFVIFDSATLSEAVHSIGSLFGAGNLPFVTEETLYYLRSFAVSLILGLIGATPVVRNAVNTLKKRTSVNRILNVVEPVLMVILLIAVTAYLVDGSFNPFLYFRF
ncbi:MAG: MBOAT family protein [Clostridia bacterium]|nr:MBOAT family protein [Clostridia bacterium]